MKKLTVALLAVALFVSLAAGAETEPSLVLWAIQSNAPARIDLNGDGIPERVTWRALPMEYDEAGVAVEVAGAGWQTAYETEFPLRGVEVCAADLDGDSASELLISGDAMSDDYVTVALTYREGSLEMIPFRMHPLDETVDPVGGGKVAEIYGGTVRLEGWRDSLGTYWSSGLYELKDGEFVSRDGGIWTVNEPGADGEVFWLEVTRDLPVVMDDAGESMLRRGDRIRVIASDGAGLVRFARKDSGMTGEITLGFDEERWTRLIDGRPIDEFFAFLPFSG